MHSCVAGHSLAEISATQNCGNPEVQGERDDIIGGYP